MLAKALHQVKDVLNQNGFFDEEELISRVRKKGYNVARRDFRALGEVIRQGWPQVWEDMLRGSQEDQVEGDGLTFTLVGDIKHKTLNELSTKFWYSFLVRKIFKQPAASAAWSRIFPSYSMTDIWANRYSFWISPAMFNANFLLRHRRVLVSIVLHQIHKDSYSRTCAVCECEEEDFDHFMLHCRVVRFFRDWVKGVLTKKCRVNGLEGEKWDWVWCFGFGGKMKGLNMKLVNLILDLARYVVYIARNYALFEQKIINRRGLFKNLVVHYLEIIFRVDKENFGSRWGSNNNLCGVDREGRLICDFG